MGIYYIDSPSLPGDMDEINRRLPTDAGAHPG